MKQDGEASDDTSAGGSGAGGERGLADALDAVDLGAGSEVRGRGVEVGKGEVGGGGCFQRGLGVSVEEVFASRSLVGWMCMRAFVFAVFMEEWATECMYTLSPFFFFAVGHVTALRCTFSSVHARAVGCVLTSMLDVWQTSMPCVLLWYSNTRL